MDTFLASAASVITRVQSDSDYMYTTTSTDTTDPAALMAASGITLGVYCVLFVVMILAYVFTVWMLVDVANRNTENKTMWVILMSLPYVAWLAALVYFFAVRMPAKSAEKAGTATA